MLSLRPKDIPTTTRASGASTWPARFRTQGIRNSISSSSIPGNAIRDVASPPGRAGCAGNSWLRIALVWTDYPGRSVQNHLRIILDTRKNGQVVNWVGNADAVALITFSAHDPRTLLPGHANLLTRDPQNNVQIIRARVEPGSHMLALFADSLLKLPQDFAMVATYPVDAIDLQVA